MQSVNPQKFQEKLPYLNSMKPEELKYVAKTEVVSNETDHDQYYKVGSTKSKLLAGLATSIFLYSCAMWQKNYIDLLAQKKFVDHH